MYGTVSCRYDNTFHCCLQKPGSFISVPLWNCSSDLPCTLGRYAIQNVDVHVYKYICSMIVYL